MIAKRAFPLFPHRLYDQSPCSGAGVKVEEHDLLPRAQRETTRDKGYRQRGADEGGADVGLAVIISPAQVVAVIPVGRCDLVEHLPEVVHRTALVLDGGQASGRAGAKDGDDACLYPESRTTPAT